MPVPHELCQKFQRYRESMLDNNVLSQSEYAMLFWCLFDEAKQPRVALLNGLQVWVQAWKVKWVYCSVLSGNFAAKSFYDAYYSGLMKLKNYTPPVSVMATGQSVENNSWMSDEGLI